MAANQIMDITLITLMAARFDLSCIFLLKDKNLNKKLDC